MTSLGDPLRSLTAMVVAPSEINNHLLPSAKQADILHPAFAVPPPAGAAVVTAASGEIETTSATGAREPDRARRRPA